MDSPTSEASFDFVDTSRAESGGTFEVAESGGTFQVEEKGGDKSGTAANQQQQTEAQRVPFLPQKPLPIHPFRHPSIAFRHPAIAFRHPAIAFRHPSSSFYPSSSAFRQPIPEGFSSRPSSSASGTPSFALPPPVTTQVPSPYGIYSLLQTNPSAFLPQQQSECCVVCSDNASGHHYGLRSCEGCKAFFKRSILSGQNYKCAKNNQCPVDPISRIRCQKCRLEKCLARGMNPTLVKNRKKNDSEQNLGLEGSRQTMARVNVGVVDAFKLSFLVPVGEGSAQLIHFADIAQARSCCQLFVNAISEFSVAKEEIILNDNKVTAILAVLTVLLTGNEHPLNNIPNYKEQLNQVRHRFSDIRLAWEEVAVYMSIMITFDDRSKRVDKTLCHVLFTKLSDRGSEDVTLEVYTKLIINISQLS